MTNAEMLRRIEIVQDRMRTDGLRWGRIVIELGQNGEARHVNSTLEVIPENYRKNEEVRSKN